MSDRRTTEGYRVAVIGATGQVGRLMLTLLRERSFPAREIVPFASERSAGSELAGFGRVQALSEQALEGFDVALFSAGGSVSGQWAPRFADAGAIVIDNSSRWRMDPAIPLIVAEVNAAALATLRRSPAGGAIIANPNCSTMQMVVALAPIHAAAGIERLVIATYQAVSGTGKRAVAELEAQARAVLEARSAGRQAQIAPEVYPHQIAFNVLPQAGSFPEGDDHTDEERKLMGETRKILGDESIRVSATCARVPVFIGHSEAVNVQTREAISPQDARELLAAAPGVRVLDDPGRAEYPLASAAAGRDEVLVGRLRRDPSHERALDMWIVADNLRKGAATNAVQIAELAHERGLIQGGRPLAAAG
ncbi:MAG TPA: aspartate-semialdehyde dehydrogenase [Solirubrobacteraceae bacterium]|nr:aspartate-semialdehyde dehydrogenase [Solirubrobacteraceae bacterium]